VVTRARSLTAWGVLVATAPIVAAACREPLDDNLSEVDAPRVVAIVATPPEAKPNEEVAYRALLVDASGEIVESTLDWAYCIARKPQSTLGPVSDACLAQAGPQIVPIGNGLSVAGLVPADACRLFGPDPPEAALGEPAGRPLDPDPSGGYFQPIRVLTGLEPTGVVVSGVRIACGVAGASPEVGADFGRRYRPNDNPVVESLTWVEGGSVIAPDDDASGHGAPTLTVARGARMTLRVAWPGCPESPTCGDGMCTLGETEDDCALDCTEPDADCGGQGGGGSEGEGEGEGGSEGEGEGEGGSGSEGEGGGDGGSCVPVRGCGGSELYVLHDIERRELVSQRESIRVAWLTTAGTFEVDHTGRTAGEASSRTSDNVWIAPDVETDATIFVVLRDDRGGTGYRRYRVHVGG
jgi:hypothetical protein